MKQDDIELIFKMSFNDVINELHLKRKMSINQLSKLSKVSRDTFMRLCKKYNLKTLSHKEAINSSPLNKGKFHWAFGKKRPAISERMKLDNPSFNNSNLIKMAISKSIFLKKNPLPQEKLFMLFIDKYSVEYIFQHPINRYVIDFFIPKLNLCIEIESDDKWCKVKRNRCAVKKLFLEKLGYKVLNISRNKISESFIFNILQTNNII